MSGELLVRAAGFSPVKGMRHLAHESVRLDALGPVGDRAWCLVDVEALRVLRTVQHPSLISVVARAEGGRLAMSLPSVETVSSEPAPTGESLAAD